ncbi:MAG: hypothetical protein ACFCUJ_13205, partial [Thiotrichales bacterium]
AEKAAAEKAAAEKAAAEKAAAEQAPAQRATAKPLAELEPHAGSKNGKKSVARPSAAQDRERKLDYLLTNPEEDDSEDDGPSGAPGTLPVKPVKPKGRRGIRLKGADNHPEKN